MKKKIKIVISDMHLGLGRILENGAINSLEEFYYGEKFVEFLHYYSSGEFKEYEIELIINGDFLNFLQVDYKGHFLSVVTESVSIEKLKGIVKGHQKVFEALKDFCSLENRSIVYIVGNHDQPMLWPGTKAYLREIIGNSLRFKNMIYFVDGVHIEHGHMHEAANRLDSRKFFLKRNLPEPILNLPFGAHFFIEYVMKIKQEHPYVDKIRPFHRMIRWLIFNEPFFALKHSFTLFAYFIRSFLRKDSRRSWSLKSLFKVMFESAVFPDLSESAKKILNDERVHTVIFGHTHVYEYRQWDHNKEYFNTGTWTELTSIDLPNIGKITKLTYVFLEYRDDQERPRGRLKEWKGYHRIEEDVVVG